MVLDAFLHSRKRAVHLPSSSDLTPLLTALTSSHEKLYGPSPLMLHRLALSRLLSEIRVPRITPVSVPATDGRAADVRPAATAARAMPLAPSLETKKRTGVYFNNCEMEFVLHPSQVRYDKKYSSKVSQLPTGRPLSIPPRLKCGPKLMNGVPSNVTQASSTSTPVTATEQLSSVAKKNDAHENRPVKRARHDKAASASSPHERKLSDEQQVFLEAALALSVCKNASVSPNGVKKTPAA
jgi:hypothetical protein